MSLVAEKVDAKEEVGRGWPLGFQHGVKPIMQGDYTSKKRLESNSLPKKLWTP